MLPVVVTSEALHGVAVIEPPAAIVSVLYCGTRTASASEAPVAPLVLYEWVSALHDEASVIVFPATEPTVTNS